MKNSNSDSFSDDGVVQRLNFNTPEKRGVSEWRISPNTDDIARKLFDSNPKHGETKKNIILVMPFFEEEKEPVESRNILASIHEIVGQ